MTNHKIHNEDIDVDKEIVIVNGERFTEQDAEDLDAELSGRDRSNANLVPGRKSLSGAGEHSPIVQTRVPTTVRVKLQKIADRRGVRTSKLLREAIDQFIEREERPPRPTPFRRQETPHKFFQGRRREMLYAAYQRAQRFRPARRAAADRRGVRGIRVRQRRLECPVQLPLSIRVR